MKAAAHLIEALATIPLVLLGRLLRLVRRPTRVVIVGWWGSETVGDVAILGQLLNECAEVAPEAPITLVSFDRDVSSASLAELAREDVRLVGVGVRSAWAIATGRALIFGGGPLMESPSMPLWALRARLARLGGARVLVYACGIGPVRNARTAGAIRRLLRASTQVVLRDQKSFDWDPALSTKTHAVVSFDPAFDYAQALRSKSVSRRKDQLALVLRVPPATYLDGIDTESGAEMLVRTIADALNALIAERQLSVVGCVMHTGFSESDDHSAYERIRARLHHPERLTVAPGRHSVASVVRTLETSGAALTVRFHGMILALASATPFVAIDYARPSGKVSAAAALAGHSDAVVRWDALDAADLARRLRELLDRSALLPDAELGAARDVRMRALRAALD